jgi:hypothetical protein
MEQMQYHALGLNRNFPRNVLHGPLMLGGLGIPSPAHKVTALRLNYFLYNMRRSSPVSHKLEISLIISQLEIGIFGQFLAQSYESYGFLATLTLGTQIWQETEPNGIRLQAAPSAIWTPSPQGVHDLPIIELAKQVYNKKGVIMINRCRLYLNIISIYDLYLYDGSIIHPSYLKQEYPPSRLPTAHWPAYPKPPKSYWVLWAHFLHGPVSTYRNTHTFQWNTASSPNYKTIFFRHRSSLKLYRILGNDVSEFSIRRVHRNKVYYTNVPYHSDMSHNDDGFYSVEVTFTTTGILYLSKSAINSHDTIGPSRPPSSLQARFRALPESLQQLCGRVTFPPDDGLSLFRAIQANGGQVYGSDNLSSLKEPISAMIYGVSDASVKSPSAAHAWILSSGAKTDLDNPLLHIAGTGPVDGYVPYLSSTRGELQGQTALTIITNLFLQHHNFQATLVMICDSKSAQSIQVRPATRLRQHRDPDLDLRLQIQHEASSLSIRRE